MKQNLIKKFRSIKNLNMRQIIIIIIILPMVTFGQLTVINPGLEGTPGECFVTPTPWGNCMPFGFFVPGAGDSATPDTQPGCYNITLAPSEGDSYIGLGHIPNYNLVNPGLGVNEWQEGFAQELSSPMIANDCPYVFTIDLANGLTADPWNGSNIATTIGEIRVFGGFDLCSEQELLWSSGPVTNEEWETYVVDFIPSDDYSHISFQCVKTEENAICAYLLADNITPIINAAPNSNAGGNQDLCENTTNLNANNIEDDQTGAWSLVSGNANFTDINDPNTLISNLNTGDNIFQWSVSADCTIEIGTSQVIINVSEEPNPNAGVDQQLCEDFTNLNANNPGISETGSWNIISGSGSFQNTTDPNTIISNLGIGENILQWTLSSDICGNFSDQIVLDLYQEPSPNAGIDQQLCDDFTNLNANNPGISETGSWSIISGSGSFQDSTDPNTVINNLGIGENILQWTLSSFVCGNFSDQIVIDVTAIPNPNAGSDQQLCDDFTNLDANNPGINETGSWNIISGSGSFQDITNPTTLITNLAEGENILQWTLSSDLCGDFSDQISVNYINSNINVNAGQNIQLCEDFTYLNGNEPNGIESGYWNVISGSGVFENPNNPNTLIEDLGIGNNIFEWTISDPCASLSSQVNITLEIVNISVDNISNYTDYGVSCNGSNDGWIDVLTTGGYPPYTYNWIGPDDFTSNSEDVNGLISGNYECAITDDMMCEQTIYVSLEQPPPIELEALSFDDLDCFNNGHIEYSANGGAGVLIGFITSSWGEDISFTWDENGVHYTSYEDFNQWDGTVTLTTTDGNGCEASLEDISIQSWDDPIAHFELSTYNAMREEIIDLFDNSYSDANIVSWSWDFGDGNMSNAQNPTHIYKENGQYIICLTIEDVNGCTSEECQLINIYNNTDIFIPNIFTVNNDNINEYFKPIIHGLLVNTYSMLIYDRWGKLLFSTKNHEQGWDGTHNGETLKQDIYSYKVRYKTINQDQKEYIGKVALVK